MIDYINLFAYQHIDYVCDDLPQKQGYILPGCGFRIEGFEEILARGVERVRLVLLGTYKENEAKILAKCRAVLPPQTRYVPLYTPSNLTWDLTSL